MSDLGGSCSEFFCLFSCFIVIINSVTLKFGSGHEFVPVLVFEWHPVLQRVGKATEIGWSASPHPRIPPQPEDGSSKVLRNSGIRPQHDTTLQ